MHARSEMTRAVRTLREWLDDLVTWGDRVAAYLEGVDLEVFLEDRLRQDAVVRCIECIGEAARNILNDPRSADLSHLDLYQAYWARNRFAHGYYDLDMERVWETASVSVPRLVMDARIALDRMKD